MRGSLVVRLCVVALVTMYGLASVGVVLPGRSRPDGDARARPALSSFKASLVFGLRARYDDVKTPACDGDVERAWLHVFVATPEGTVPQPAVLTRNTHRLLQPAPRPPPSA